MKYPVFIAFFSALATALAGCSSHQGRSALVRPALIAPVQVSVNRDVTFTPASWPQALDADLYQPVGNGPFPAVIMIHGGGWEGRSREDMENIAKEVASRGFLVMNMSYRFAPRWRFPAQLQDVQQAVLWLKANAQRLDIMADRIGAWGYSAGAHLAALAGVTGPQDDLYVAGTQVQAVVAGGTPVDLRYYKDGKLTNSLLGVSYMNDPLLWRNASPLALVTADDAPMFLYHGTFDFTVGVDNARNMHRALKSAGIPTELMLLRGREHLSSFIADAPVRMGIEFLDMHLRQGSRQRDANMVSR